MTDKQHYIYALADPNTSEVRYIGRTKNPTARIYRHLQPMFSSNGIKQWIKALGQPPKMVILEQCSEESVIERESYWTNYYREIGANLINRGKASYGRVR